MRSNNSPTARPRTTRNVRVGAASITYLWVLLASASNINAVDVSGQQSGAWRRVDSPIRVVGTVEVASGTTLTIEPGTVIRSDSYWNNINVRGTLNAIGTASQVIVFTSTTDNGGDQWGGIYFHPGSIGVIQQAECRYGGGDAAGMIQINQARVTVQNVSFLNSGEDGIYISNISDPQMVSIRQCVFQGNAEDGIQCSTASPTISGCSFSNNGATAIRLTGTSSPDFNVDLAAPTDGIHLIGATLQANSHWENAGIPYILDGTIVVPTNTSLTIDPGVVIKGSSYWNNILIRGQLSILGTSGQPVFLTSWQDDTIGGDTNGDGTKSVPKGDQWGGIYFDPGSTGLVQNAECRYGGGDAAGMVQINQARVTVQNVKFLNSGEDGLRISSINDPQMVVIQQCVFQGNEDDGIQCNSASPRIVSCSFSGNESTAMRLTGTSSPDFNGDLTAPTDGIHLIGATLQANSHWEYAGIPYVLDGTISVPTNTSLTIDPAVVVKGSSYWNNILIRGQLSILGTPAQPVFLTSWQDDTVAGDTNGDGTNSVPKKDQWGGVYFYPGSTGLIQHAECRYGGGDAAGMIQIDRARVTIQNVKFLKSGEDGIHVSNIMDPQMVVIQQCVFNGNEDDGIQCNSASPTITDCAFSGNRVTAIRLTGTSSPDFAGNLSGMVDGIHLIGATLETNARWKYAGIPYILDGTIVVPTNRSLTIDAGVVIKGASFWNNVLIRGQLSILGTPAQPVYLTSLRDDTIAGDTNEDGTNSVPAGDQWGGIYFYPGSTGIVLQAEFRYGGGDAAGMIQIDQARVTVENVKFRSSGEDGIRVANIIDPQMVVVQRCVFQGNEDDGIQCVAASPTIAGCRFSGNGAAIYLTSTSFPNFQGDLTADREGIWLGSMTLSHSGTFDYAGIPYILSGNIVVPSGTQLNVEPGVIFKGNSYWNSITVDGRLEAPGTAERPIYFTSYIDDLGGDTNQDGQEPQPQQPAGGDWGGIKFRSGSTGALAYVHLRYGGGDSAGLVEIDDARVTLEQCHLTDSSENGIWYGEYTLEGNPPAIHQCNITGNQDYGIRNAGSKQVDATQAWWGHATGPYHKNLNPAGQGDAVTDRVLFVPFLTGPIGLTVPVQIVQGPQSQVATLGQTVTLTVLTTGTWPIMHQWYKNQEPIAGATGAALVLENAQAADSGTYVVVVGNSAGSASSAEATLTVTSETLLVITHWMLSASGTLSIEVPGQMVKTTLLQASDNLVQWSNVFTNPPASQPAWFVDPQVGTKAARFYRLAR